MSDIYQVDKLNYATFELFVVTVIFGPIRKKDFFNSFWILKDLYSVCFKDCFELCSLHFENPINQWYRKLNEQKCHGTEMKSFSVGKSKST